MADESRGRGVSLTVKHSGAKDASWIGFTGSVEDVAADVAAWFGIDSVTLAGLTPHELSMLATNVAHGTGVVRTVLGGTPIAEGATNPSPASDPWGAAREGQPATPEEPTVNPLFGQIEKADSVDALKVLWAEHQESFKDTYLMAAWKARGKELSK